MGKWEDAGYALMTTEEMLAAMNEGKHLSLVPVTVDDEEILSHYGDAEREICFAPDSMNDIVSIEYVGEEDVQCILVDDPEHLYLTDGFIPTHNTSNIIFLKSTDDSMLDTLTKMSGKKHRVVKDTKNITQDNEQVLTPTEAKISYGMKVVEEPVISYNDLAFISERNSMVFRAGDSPIWNKNQLILPMSWRLFQNTIVHPGHKYSLQTIPTMSTAKDFDVRKNIPDFEAMLEKRMYQAMLTEDATQLYQQLTGKTDLEMEQLDPDLKAEDIMSIINSTIYRMKKQQEEAELKKAQAKESRLEAMKKRAQDRLGSEGYFAARSRNHTDDESNTELQAEVAKAEAKQAQVSEKRFANKQLSPEDFYDSLTGQVNYQWQEAIIAAFHRAKRGFMGDHRNFYFDANRQQLMSADRKTVYIRNNNENLEFSQQLSEAVSDPQTRIFAERPQDVFESGAAEKPLLIEDAFYKFLASQKDWLGIAGGQFEREFARIVAAKLRPSK